MKKYILIVSIIILSSAELTAQDKYKGNFSDSLTFLGSNSHVPIGNHKAKDKSESLKYSCTYNESGLMTSIKINIKGTKKELSFPENTEAIRWVELANGLWINKVEDNGSYSTDMNEDQVVKFHYSGYLSSGEAFDNSFIRNEPLVGKLRFFVDGFSMGLSNMKAGEFRIIKIAPEMGYGSKDVANIPANSTLIYYVFLIE